MPNTYTTPGVYIKEVSLIPNSITRDAETIPLFVGFTTNHTRNFANPGNDGETAPVTWIRSYQEYVQIFGAAKPETFSVSIEDKTVSGTISRKVSVSHVPTTTTKYLMAYAMQLYFMNGGGPCKVLSLAQAYNTGFPIADYWYNGARQFVPITEGCALLVMPDMVNMDTSYLKVVVDFLKICEGSGGKFMLIDLPQVAASGNKSAAEATLEGFRSIGSGSHLKHGAAYFPHLVTSLRYAYDPTTITLSHTLDNGKGVCDGKTLSAIQFNDTALYYDIVGRIEAVAPVMPPSSAVAGQIVRTDRERGVWKAPANISLNSVKAPALTLTTMEESLANTDASSGKSVNVIKTLPGRGTLIWGSRTLDGNSGEWRYVPVRRLFTMAEEAIKRGCEWAVFEPNDANTWLRLKSSIEAYLTQLWREGALMGAKPQEAFQVRVGLGVTMTQQDILEGMLRIEVGMAAVRPAEFIVLRISQMMQQS